MSLTINVKTYSDAVEVSRAHNLIKDKFTCRCYSMIVIEGNYLCGLFVCFI